MKSGVRANLGCRSACPCGGSRAREVEAADLLSCNPCGCTLSGVHSACVGHCTESAERARVRVAIERCAAVDPVALGARVGLRLAASDGPAPASRWEASDALGTLCFAELRAWPHNRRPWSAVVRFSAIDRRHRIADVMTPEAAIVAIVYRITLEVEDLTTARRRRDEARRTLGLVRGGS